VGTVGRKTIMNRTTSPDKTAKINKNNLQLKDDFLMYLKSVQRSPGTINGYDNDLLIVFTYIMEELGNKDFQKLSKRDIVRIQNWLTDKGNSSARIRRIKSAISSLSNYCENILADDDPDFDGYRSIVRKIENPPLIPVREKTIFEAEEIEDLLDMLVQRGLYKQACYLALAVYSGRRKAELCRFKVSDFDDNKLVFDGAMYKSDPIKSKGRGGGKMINCYTLAKKFKPYFDLWMKEREKCGIESEWLFPSLQDVSRHMPISNANSFADTFSRLSGKVAYSHNFRHFFTSELARAGIPDGVIQKILAWESADMVAVYKDIDADEEIGQYFKDGDISVPDKKNLNDL
jgi:integrase